MKNKPLWRYLIWPLVILGVYFLYIYKKEKDENKPY